MSKFSKLSRPAGLSPSARALLAGGALALASGLAQAHTGHGTHGLETGLAHPLGLDHLLAMVAVGVWSVFALPAGKAWQGPATFMAALIASALLGVAGVQIPFLEHAISLSVVLFGALLVLAARGRQARGAARLPAGADLALIAVAASLHGLAHGAETPVSGFMGYALGFLATTLALHVSGVLAGVGVRRWLAQRATRVLTGAGVGLGVAGLFLFSQI